MMLSVHRFRDTNDANERRATTINNGIHTNTTATDYHISQHYDKLIRHCDESEGNTQTHTTKLVRP